MHHNREDAINKLQALTEGIDFCMLTTNDAGVLRSRPMSTQDAEFDGDIWFFTSEDTHKVEEIEKDNRVAIAYSNAGKNTFLSISGRGSISKDRVKMEELWSPVLKAWFPDGLDDPKLCLLKVEAEQAEYWEGSSSTLVQLFGMVKAIATGQEADYGENKKLHL